MTPVRSFRLSPLALLLAGTALRPQVPAMMQVATAAPSPLLSAAQLPPRPPAQVLAKAELLPPGKVTLGTFHLNGLVTAHKSVVLRWANTHGELASEGVQVFRQKVGDKPTEWKALLGAKDLVGLFRGGKAREHIKKYKDHGDRARLDLFQGDLQYDPATKRRVARIVPDAKARPPKFDADQAIQQYRDLRDQGRLSKSDLQLLHADADTDLESAELLGLAYEDKPGRGQWRYKIQVNLRGGGVAEALCPTVFDPSVPTPVPAAQSLSAKSGNGAVYLSWEGPESGIVAGYNVYRAEGKGEFRKLNESPLKLVTLESEDPEEMVRRTSAHEAALEKEMRRNAGQPATEAKLREIRLQAEDLASLPTQRTALPADLSKSIQAGVASGQLPGKGRRTPSAAFVDTLRKAGNLGFQNEHTYTYRVTTVDIAGVETSPATAPLVAGTPKDLEPPKVPGRPRLEAEAEAKALAKLRDVQNARVKDPSLTKLSQAVASRQPHQTVALAPYLGVTTEAIPAATQPPPPTPPEFTTFTLGALRQMQHSRMVATAPVKELSEVAEAQLLHSNPDGSAPPARLVWTPSPDPDLKGYEVWRATGEGPFQKVASVATAAWVDPGLEVGQAYRYQVSAVDQLGNESGRSDAGLVAVSDSRLKDKLAIAKVEGKPSTGAAPSLPGRSFLRPEGRKPMAVATLEGMRTRTSPMTRPTASTPVVTGFVAPTHASVPKAVLPLSLKPVSATTLAFPVLAGVELGTEKPKPAAPWKKRTRERSFNPMLIGTSAGKQLRVLLEWQRPLEGRPLDYVILEAPQKLELKAFARPNLQVGHAFRFGTAAASGDLLLKGVTLQPAGSPILLAKVPGAPAGPVPQAASPTLLSTTPEHRAFTARTLVGAEGLGLRPDDGRRTQRYTYQASAGPGTFSRVNEAPVEMEKFVVTFPAEVAQYGGTTFYFRIQARTKEFGRLVEGPLSEIVEVRLPDLVAPPAPGGGAANLVEVGERLDVDLTWSAVAAPDLAGYVVDRQTFNYTLVEGEAQPGTPQGPPERLTPTPTPKTGFTDPGAPGGYQRYTLRSVDKAGNVSEPQGHYDAFVPGEPMPVAPKGLILAGGRLTWTGDPGAAGYTVWRSFTGEAGDFEQISPILPKGESGFNLPPQGTLYLRVLARSATGMHQAASESILRTP